EAYGARPLRCAEVGAGNRDGGASRSRDRCERGDGRRWAGRARAEDDVDPVIAVVPGIAGEDGRRTVAVSAVPARRAAGKRVERRVVHGGSQAVDGGGVVARIGVV